MPRKPYIDLTDPDYTPNRLINKLLEIGPFKNDLQLTKHLRLPPGSFSPVRARRKPLTPHLMVVIMDGTGIGLPELRRLAGMPARAQKGTP